LRSVEQSGGQHAAGPDHLDPEQTPVRVQVEERLGVRPGPVDRDLADRAAGRDVRGEPHVGGVVLRVVRDLHGFPQGFRAGRVQASHWSYARLATRANTTTSRTTRTKPLPRLSAVCAPRVPPARLNTAISAASCQSTAPCQANMASAPALVQQLTILAVAEAVTRSRWSRAVSASTRKVPVPGPTSPS